MSKARLFKANFIRKSWLTSFNNGFGYNRVGFERFWKLFPDNTLSSFTNFFTRATKFGGAMRGGNFKNIPPINVQKYNGVEFKFFDENYSQSTSTYNLEPGLYTSITDIVEAMNMLIQEKNNHSETWITVKVSRRTQKVVVMLANDTSGLAFCSIDLGHFFGNNVGNEFGVLMIGKGPH